MFILKQMPMRTSTIFSVKYSKALAESKVISLYLKAIIIDPNNQWYYVARGDLVIEMGDPKWKEEWHALNFKYLGHE